MTDDLQADSNAHSEGDEQVLAPKQQVVVVNDAEPSYEPGNATDTFALWLEKAVHADKPSPATPSVGETADKDGGSEGERGEAS